MQAYFVYSKLSKPMDRQKRSGEGRRCKDAVLRKSKRPVLAAVLQVHHVGVKPVLRIELVGTPLLGHSAVSQHDDLVRARDGTHPVRDDQDRLAADQAGQRRLDERLVLDVQTGRRLVEQDDGRILEEGARNGNALALAARKGAAVFADVGVSLVRELFGKFVAVGKLCRREDLLIRRVLAAEADILQNGIVKQRDVLENDGIQAHELFRVDL